MLKKTPFSLKIDSQRHLNADLRLERLKESQNVKNKMQSLRFYLTTAIVVLFTLIPYLAWAKITVSLKLDRSEMQLTDSVQVVVSVGGSRDVESEPDIQGLENFDVRSGGTSSRFEFINGKVSSSVDYTYYIQPQKTGAFQLGPARVQIKDKTYSSNTVRLRVKKSAGGKAGDRGSLFLTADLSNDTVYVEEQTLYTLKLYLRRNVRNINLNLPEVENLIIKQIAKPLEYRSTFSGQNYQVVEVRYALVPSKAGSYTVTPAKMSMTVLDSRRKSSRSFFDDPFSSFATGRPVTLVSDALKLTVMVLPEEGKPPDFSGLVGKFKISSKLEPETLKAGESATLTVSVSGQGNVNRIPDLKIPELKQVKIYADQPVLESSPDSAGTKGSKTMKWALVPEKDGRIDVPAVSISYFDPENHRYKTLQSARYSLSVLPGKKETVAVSESPATLDGNDRAVKQTIKELGRDIFPVHSNMPNFKTSGRRQLESWILGAMLGLPILLYLGTLCAVKLRRNSETGQSDNLAKKAAREFNKQYRSQELSASKLLQLIRDYLNLRFGRAYGALTSQEAVNLLVSQKVGAATVEKMQKIIQQLENAEYTGHGHQTAIIDHDLGALVKQIEKESR